MPSPLAAASRATRSTSAPGASFDKALLASGAYLGGEPLHPPETGTTVRVRDGRRDIQDGPYANTKEQLAGFILLELDTLDAALDWAARCPASQYAAVEVRPVASSAKSKVASGPE